MIWSDAKIKENSKIIAPFDESSVQPNSYDLHLGSEIITFSDGYERVRKLPYTLQPGEFILATTKERVSIPNECAAQVDGKSSIGRMGIQVHLTAGWIDSGFKGEITLEMYNVLRRFELTEGMPIAQIIFMDSYKSDKLYKGHYQNQKGATLSHLLNSNDK